MAEDKEQIDIKELDKKYETLCAILRDMGSVVIGFSGGVDSTFLTYAAHDVLKDRVLAVTAVSPTLPASEKKRCRIYGKANQRIPFGRSDD